MGDPLPITPRDIREWSEATGSILRREEAAILLRMDGAFREAWAAEAADQQARREAERKQR
jgi:hypothetical protein